MEYRSPVRLVLHAAEPIQPFQPQAIHRARKKLLAEMALQDQQLEIDGILYTRNDVLSLLENIDADAWKAHCTIYAHEALLRFVEKQEFDAEKFGDARNLLYNGPFISFLSPWFAASFDTVTNDMLRQDDLDSLNKLLGYRSFILPDHEHDAYRRIRIHLDELQHMLKNLSWEKFSAGESILYFLFDDEWISFVNRLPDSFATTRDELVRLLLQVIYRFQGKASWYYLHRCCLQVQKIECSPVYREQVTEYEKTIGANAGGEGTREKKGSGITGRTIFFSIWIILMIVRAANNCNKTDSTYEIPHIVVREEDQGVPESPGFYEELNSSGNERNLKNFFYGLSLGKHSGEPVEMKDGRAPFSEISRSPEDEDEATITIRNRTGFDAVMFYFVNTNLLLDDTSKLFAVYIKKGSSYTFGFRPNFGRFNFAFGHQWLRLDPPIEFTLRDFVNENSARPVSSTGKRIGIYNIDGYFQEVPRLEQYYLNHDITLMNFEPSYSANNPAPKKIYSAP
ncbi:MAG TPA: hypothetical protein VGB46_05830, partial [Flavisolibacter sp.]